jgi:hypothetical protein
MILDFGRFTYDSFPILPHGFFGGLGVGIEEFRGGRLVPLAELPIGCIVGPWAVLNHFEVIAL